jgi:hypothetical protein
MQIKFWAIKTFTNYADFKAIGLFVTKNQLDVNDGVITMDSKLGIEITLKIYIQ